MSQRHLFLSLDMRRCYFDLFCPKTYRICSLSSDAEGDLKMPASCKILAEICAGKGILEYRPVKFSPTHAMNNMWSRFARLTNRVSMEQCPSYLLAQNGNSYKMESRAASLPWPHALYVCTSALMQPHRSSLGLGLSVRLTPPSARATFWWITGDFDIAH